MLVTPVRKRCPSWIAYRPGPSQSGQANSNSSSVAIQQMVFTTNEQNHASTLLIRCLAAAEDGLRGSLLARPGEAGTARTTEEANRRRRTRPCGTTTVERARRHGNRRSMVQPGAWAGGRSRQLPRIMESHKNLHVAYTRGRSREDNGRQPEAPRTFGMPGRQIRATGSKSHKHRPSIVPILLVLEKGSLCFQRSSAATWLPCAMLSVARFAASGPSSTRATRRRSSASSFAGEPAGIKKARRRTGHAQCHIVQFGI